MFGIVTLYNNSQSDNLTDKQYRVHYGHDPNDERKAGADNIYNKDCKQTLHLKITVFNTCCVKYNFRFTLIIFFSAFSLQGHLDHKNKGLLQV